MSENISTPCIPLPPPPAHGIKHVAIVGAGIAGLCTALSLVRTARIPAHCIVMYEPRDGLDTGRGAGLNLNSGAAILSREYGVHVSRHGVRATRAYSTLHESSTSTSTSTTLQVSPACVPSFHLPTRRVSHYLETSSTMTTQLDEDESMISPPSTTSKTLFDIDFSQSFANTYLSRRDGSAHVVTILRENLQRDLNRVVLNLGVNILRGPNYEIKQVNEDRTLVLADGTITERAYDLIVGADGVNSKVKDAVLKSSSSSKIPIRRKRNKKDTGIRVAWLVTNEKIVQSGEMTQTICDGGAVAAYAVSTNKNMIAFLYRDITSKKDKLKHDENVNYEEEDECSRRAEIVKRMKIAKVPDFLIKPFESQKGRFIESAVHEHAQLSQWSRDRIVLVGDAAHAMAPFLGQGANQTIQDAHVLALSLRLVGDRYTNVDEALKGYERTFKREVGHIVRKSRVLGYVLTRDGKTGHMLRRTLLALSRTTGMLEKEIVQAFQPRFL